MCVSRVCAVQALALLACLLVFYLFCFLVAALCSLEAGLLHSFLFNPVRSCVFCFVMFEWMCRSCRLFFC